MPRTAPVDVFGFLDFRALLAELYRVKKEAGRGFSYRAFSRRAGLRSPNHLKRVIDGERNLTADMAVRYAEAMGLEGDEASYFTDLVRFNQAKTSAERNAAYQRLTGFRGYRKAHRLDMAHAAYHATWYLPAIRELAVRPDFRDDPAWIARRMLPPISPREAERALATLFELGLLVREPDGSIGQGEAVVSTGPETVHMHIGNYHRTMLERGAAAIELLEPSERDVSSLTFCVGEDGLRRIKERIVRFRKEIIALATMEDDGEQVVQLGMQLFPLSTRRGEEEQ